MAVESAVNNSVLKELVEPAVTRPTARILMITVVNPCRRALTLASRGVRIAVTDLTPFLPIQSYGGLAAKTSTWLEIPFLAFILLVVHTRMPLDVSFPMAFEPSHLDLCSSSYAQISDKSSGLTAL
ncbi:hypothetical protein PIB30_026326 [Stylosanthes scabra]|uniref:Uncharacterized protein n=1 Tax=Stylosanthes scabra TaxID=79078 RepID=A0ABU6X7V7_9FABA|nr:hypothetical protein [Stylosanthes scabra]